MTTTEQYTESLYQLARESLQEARRFEHNEDADPSPSFIVALELAQELRSRIVEAR